jgi:hypothetical protein
MNSAPGAGLMLGLMLTEDEHAFARDLGVYEFL